MRHTIVVIGVLLLIAAAMYFGARMIAPGAYPFAEVYELDNHLEEVTEAIKAFKRKHPEYVVPNVTIEGNSFNSLNDHQTKNPDYSYTIYFYLKDENKILNTWVRLNSDARTDFAFVAVNDGLELGHWKTINDDFSWSENRRYKKKFEELILKPIKNELTH